MLKQCVAIALAQVLHAGSNRQWSTECQPSLPSHAVYGKVMSCNQCLPRVDAKCMYACMPQMLTHLMCSTSMWLRMRAKLAVPQRSEMSQYSLWL